MPSPACLVVLLTGLFIAGSYGASHSQAVQRKASLEDSLLGNWTGTSICQVKSSPCRDENVVFHFSPGNGPNQYKVDADKIVNGQQVNMGELDFILNPSTHTLTCLFPNGTWVLVVNKRHMEGTLTTTDKVLYRKLSLSKTP